MRKLKISLYRDDRTVAVVFDAIRVNHTPTGVTIVTEGMSGPSIKMLIEGNYIKSCADGVLVLDLMTKMVIE